MMTVPQSNIFRNILLKPSKSTLSEEELDPSVFQVLLPVSITKAFQDSTILTPLASSLSGKLKLAVGTQSKCVNISRNTTKQIYQLSKG